jgi:hypothetical protein
MAENGVPKIVVYINLKKKRLRGRPRNRWQDEVREDGRMVGGEGWPETVANRRGGGFGGVQTPPEIPKFFFFDKAEPNSQFRGKYFRNNLIRIRGSLICKLSGTPA